MLLLVRVVLFALVAGGAVVAAGGLFKNTVLAWWRGQKAFPHWRDPNVIARDNIARAREAALIREEKARADYEIALQDARTRQTEVLTNLQITRIHSGEVEDEVTRLANKRAEELEARAADIRAGKITVDDLSSIDVGPVPDLGDGLSEKDRDRDGRKRVR